MSGTDNDIDAFEQAIDCAHKAGQDGIPVETVKQAMMEMAEK